MDSSDWASIALFKIERVWAAKTVDRYRKKLQIIYLPFTSILFFQSASH